MNLSLITELIIILIEDDVSSICENPLFSYCVSRQLSDFRLVTFIWSTKEPAEDIGAEISWSGNFLFSLHPNSVTVFSNFWSLWITNFQYCEHKKRSFELSRLLIFSSFTYTQTIFSAYIILDDWTVNCLWVSISVIRLSILFDMATRSWDLVSVLIDEDSIKYEHSLSRDRFFGLCWYHTFYQVSWEHTFQARDSFGSPGGSWSVLIVTRKYDTLIHSVGYGRKRWDTLAQPTIVVSRIMERGRLSLFTPLYHYKVIWAWENLTLYHPCTRRRRSKSATMIGTEEETAKKKAHTWWIFKLRRLVSCHLVVEGWRLNELPFLRRREKTRNLEYERNPNSKIMPRREPWVKRKSFSFEWSSTPSYGEPR